MEREAEKEEDKEVEQEAEKKEIERVAEKEKEAAKEAEEEEDESMDHAVFVMDCDHLLCPISQVRRIIALHVSGSTLVGSNMMVLYLVCPRTT